MQRPLKRVICLHLVLWTRYYVCYSNIYSTCIDSELVLKKTLATQKNIMTALKGLTQRSEFCDKKFFKKREKKGKKTKKGIFFDLRLISCKLRAQIAFSDLIVISV